MPRAATAAARAKLRALASTYEADSASDSDAYAGSAASAASSSDELADEGSSSDFDPPSEEDAPKGKGRGKQTARPKRTGGPRVAGMATAGGKNSLGLNAAELRLLGQSGGIAARTPTRGAGGTGRVGVFPGGGPSPFITRLEWDDAEEEEVGEADEDDVGWRDPRKARVVVEDGMPREQRRERYRDLARNAGVLCPPECWEGEGWIPEMLSEPTGDGLPDGWRYRTDVRLDVPLPAYEYLSEDEARKHIPGGERRVQLGPDAAIEAFPLLQSKAFTSSSASTAGVMFNAGAPVWGLDWAPGSQHVAVATCGSDPVMGSRTSTPGSIQLWSDEGQCQVILCTEAEVCFLKWMPVGVRDENTLGLLAAAQLDGVVAVYAVPRPGPERRYVRAEVLVALEVEDATPMCLDWICGARLAVGLSNGHIGTWNVLAALQTEERAPLPDTYTPVALAAISSLCVGRVPPIDLDAEPLFGEDPYLIVFSSYDGSTGLLDLRDPAGTLTFCRSRIPCASVAFSAQNAAPLYIDSDYMVVMAQLRNAANPGTFILAPNRAPVLSLACSDYHPMVAAAAGDGSLTLSSAGTGFFRRKGVGLFFLRVYEVDYSERAEDIAGAERSEAAPANSSSETANGKGKEQTGSGGAMDVDGASAGVYRLTDGFMPDHSTIEATNKRKVENRDDTAVKTAAWDREVGLHRAAWQNGNGLRNAGWLASAGYSGIVRLEEVRGTRLWRWE